MQLEFFYIPEETADGLPAATSFPIPDICAQYPGDLKLIVSKLAACGELTQINLAGNNSTQTTVEGQTCVTSLPEPEKVSAIQHGNSIRTYRKFVKQYSILAISLQKSLMVLGC